MRSAKALSSTIPKGIKEKRRKEVKSGKKEEDWAETSKNQKIKKEKKTMRAMLKHRNPAVKLKVRVSFLK